MFRVHYVRMSFMNGKKMRPPWKKYVLLYRVVKQNLQVVKLVDSEHVNENMVQNSSPTCKHNLFTLIQSKKMFVECPGM